MIKPDTGIFGSSGVPVAVVTVVPDAGTLAVGDTLRLVATPHDAQGLVLTGRTITYASSDTVVATVSASALVRARQVGSVTITATSEHRSTTAQFQVR